MEGPGKGGGWALGESWGSAGESWGDLGSPVVPWGAQNPLGGVTEIGQPEPPGEHRAIAQVEEDLRFLGLSCG